MIYYYRKPEPNEFIVIGADPAEGNDNSTFVALSKHKSDVIMIGKSKEESTQLGHALNHVGKWIHKQTNVWPLIAPEKNVGTACIHILKTLNYPSLFSMPDSFVRADSEPTEDYGWVTSSATRPKMLDDLALAIRQKSIVIYSKIILDELFTFIRNIKTGKPEADNGSHDDLVISLAIAWQLYQIAPNPVSFQDEDVPDDTTRVANL